MSKTFQFHARGHYYRRHRSLPVFEGGEIRPEVNALITRWGYQQSYHHRPHDVYYYRGVFYEIHNVPVEGDETGPTKWAHCFVPCDHRHLADRHPDQTRDAGDVPACVIQISDGHAVCIKGAPNTDLEGVVLWNSDNDAEEYALALLDLER